jgi:hypothetical protein
MKAIAMNVGLGDGLLQPNRDMDAALTDAGVAHHFETFDGDQDSQVPMNFQTKVLPFFSRELAFQKYGSASHSHLAAGVTAVLHPQFVVCGVQSWNETTAASFHLRVHRRTWR